jgi:beta-aspartyl-peptidase (threonine type)
LQSIKRNEKGVYSDPNYIIMRKLFLLYLLIFILISSCNMDTKSGMKAENSSKPEYALVIHGGAGTILKADMTADQEAAYLAALDSALEAGKAILASDGTALEAVEAAIVFMEDNPLFNAGKGAVFTNEGKNELDASVMLGQNLMAGSVGSVTTIKNPIRAAIAVMQKSEHVMMIGAGAEKFAALNGLEIVDPSYFYTESRWNSLQKAKEKEAQKEKQDAATRHGTVGAVALDKSGNIAAGTSTGGMTNKRFNRIGDAPIIGAGTYASNETCGISATGHGEYFIRLGVAHAIHAQMKYGKSGLAEAAADVIQKQLTALGGDGGIIGLDKNGNIVMEFNSEGMYRGWILPDKKYTGIFKAD